MLTNPLLAPLVGVLSAVIGAALGAIGNNLLTRSREDRAWQRDKKLDLYLALLTEEAMFRNFVGDFDLSETGPREIEAEWAAWKLRASSLDVRTGLFANEAVRRVYTRYMRSQGAWFNYFSIAEEVDHQAIGAMSAKVVANGHAIIYEVEVDLLAPKRTTKRKARTES